MLNRLIRIGKVCLSFGLNRLLDLFVFNFCHYLRAWLVVSLCFGLVRYFLRLWLMAGQLLLMYFDMWFWVVLN